ncbi:MAG: hypothetical protein ABW104_20880 [Candidatus Thiodiazotropha sp. 6PLUC2]
MMKVHIDGNPNELLESIIEVNPEGELKLGLTGICMETATIEDLFEREVLFRDYLMEGFVKFYLKATVRPNGLELFVKGTGGNREQYLGAHFKFMFKQVGHDATAF